MKEIIRNSRRVFSRYPIFVSYLFGSQATGTSNMDSDYDFAVFFSPKVTPTRYLHYKLQLISDLVKIVDREFVDLVILNDLRIPLLLKFGTLFLPKI